MTDTDMTRPAPDDYPKDPDHAPAVESDPADADTERTNEADKGSDQLEELEGPAEEMEGEASASEDSLNKEQPQHQHQLGERA
jgi:hypothetical protein